MERNLTGLKRLIRAKTAIGTLPEITEYTATGNPATFSTNMVQPLQAVEIPFMPVQSGSGTPSPDNVRPISGWPGVTVTINGQTILVAWESVAGVVYGGTVDLVTGVMTVTHALKIMDGATSKCAFTNKGGTTKYDVFYYMDSTIDLMGSSSVNYVSVATMAEHHIATNYFANTDFSAPPDAGVPRFAMYRGDSGKTIQPRIGWNLADGIDTLEKANTWLAERYAAGQPFMFTFPLKNTVQYTMTQLEIKTIIGQNSIATNTAGTNTIKYLKRG